MIDNEMRAILMVGKKMRKRRTRGEKRKEKRRRRIIMLREFISRAVCTARWSD